MCDVFQVLHVGLNDKSPEQGKVGVFDVVDFDKAPGILPPTHLLSIHLQCVCPRHHCERYAVLQGPVLSLLLKDTVILISFKVLSCFKGT